MVCGGCEGKRNYQLFFLKKRGRTGTPLREKKKSGLCPVAGVEGRVGGWDGLRGKERGEGGAIWRKGRELSPTRTRKGGKKKRSREKRRRLLDPEREKNVIPARL